MINKKHYTKNLRLSNTILDFEVKLKIEQHDP